MDLAASGFGEQKQLVAVRFIFLPRKGFWSSKQPLTGDQTRLNLKLSLALREPRLKGRVGLSDRLATFIRGEPNEKKALS